MCLLAVGSLLVLLCTAQVVNEDALRKLPLPQRPGALASLAALPDGHTIAAAYSKDGGLVLIDTATWTITRTMTVQGFSGGARLTASNNGRYLLLKEVGRFTNDGRRDVNGDQAVLDVANGDVVLNGGKAVDSAKDMVKK